MTTQPDSPIFDALTAERLLATVEFDRVAAEWQDERGWLG